LLSYRPPTTPKIVSASPILTRPSEPWRIRLASLKKGTKVSGVGPKTQDAFEEILPIDSACRDIDIKMREYNKKNGQKVRYPAIINYIRG